MRCPNCAEPLRAIGFTGNGHVLYLCEKCRKRWSISEYSEGE